MFLLKFHHPVRKGLIKEFDATLVLIAAVCSYAVLKGNDVVMRTLPQDPHLLP